MAGRVEGGREPQQVIEQRAAHVGDHPLPDHAHEEELPEVRDPLHRGDADDDGWQHREDGRAIEPGELAGEVP